MTTRARSPGVRVLVALAAAAAGISLLAVSAVAGQRAHARSGGTLTLGAPNDIVGPLDPAALSFFWSWPVLYATCAKLFNYPDEARAAGTRVIPEVVARYRVSKDRRTYTFDLKRTFRFSTGARVTARSFAAALDRVASPRIESYGRQYIHEIAGADAVMSGRASTISGVRVLAPYRLRIHLTRPVGDFEARLTMPMFCPVPEGTPVVAGGADVPGSGPYYVAERVPNRRLVLRRNPHYRGSRPRNLDQIVWTFGETYAACRKATEEDRIDYCVRIGWTFIPDAAARDLVARHGINKGQFFFYPSMTTTFFRFNHERPAFKGRAQIPLKKAINFAIDRPELVRTGGYLGGVRTDQIVPPTLSADVKLYPLGGAAPATAKKWLALAPLKPPRLVLYATRIEAAQVFAFNLKQLGIDVDIEAFSDFAAMDRKMKSPGAAWDVALETWMIDYADAAGFYIPLLGRDPRYAAKIAAANRATGAARRRAWAKLEEDLMRNDPPWAPYVHGHPSDKHHLSPSFGCFFVHPVYVLDLAAACKK
jgi:ABC-type oligopeptide transport system substrate-binding subunit